MYIKRLMDLCVSLMFLILISPILLVVIILIKISSKGSVLYKQKRVGLNGIPFVAYKFRTMYDRPREVNREILKNDPEVTLVGKYLRRYKIDELPQLINVIFGNMSLVGPRPSMESLVERFNEDAHFRLLVKPGLTGLAQINGNIYLSWQERWKYDRFYAENQSLKLDLIIILKTILIIIMGEDKFIKKIS